MIQKQSQKPELTKEQKEAQKTFINGISFGRIIWLTSWKYKFQIATVYGVAITFIWAYQSLPSALAALGQ